MASPAVEKVKIEQHRVFDPAEGSNIVDSRIAALERQQAFDHTYLEQLAAAVRSIHEAQEWERLRRGEIDDQSVLMDMNLRHELAVQRTALTDMQQKVPEMASQGMKTYVTMMDDKIATIQQAIDHMHGKGERVETYLNKLHEDRPREGQAVADLVNSQVSQVKAMVSRFEPPRGQHMGPESIPFTQSMSNVLKEMQDKVAAHETALKYMTETLTHHADYEERIVATESQILRISNWVESGYADQGKNEAQKATGFSMCGAYGAGIAMAAQQAGTGTGTGSSTSGCRGDAPTEQRSFGAGGGAGSSGDGDPTRALLAAVVGGNGQCHCVHVKTLIGQVAALEARGEDGQHAVPGRGRDPWHSGLRRDGVSPGRDHDQQARQGGGAERTALPLELRGPFGALNFKESALFDQKISMTSDYSFNGLKGGLNWKGKVERYFISRIPVLMNILEWAEKEELYEITQAKFEEATRGTLFPAQVQAINAAMWGFLSGAVSGTAETMFKGAAKLNGLDAWRRLVRYIDHGRAMRLETLRREVKMIHLKPIASLEKVEEGVAEFENVLNEYVQVGGTPVSNDEKKSDLLAVLPAELRETLLWRATDPGSFEGFRDMVLTQCGKVLMNRKRLHLHNVDHGKQQDEADEEEEGFPDLSTPEGILAAISRLQRNGGKFQRRSSGGNGAAPGARAEPPRARKCANCSEIHEGRCTKAAVAQADRKCWTCGKKGCRASTCPDKKTYNNRKLQAIEDGQPGGINGFFMVDEEGFQTVNRGNRRTRPTPSQPCLGDFLSKNSFEALTPAASGNALASLSTTGRPGYPGAARHGAGTEAKIKPYVKEHKCPSGAIRHAIAEAQQTADGTGASGTGSSIQNYSRNPGTSSFQTLPGKKAFTKFPTINSTPEPPSVDFVNKNGKNPWITPSPTTNPRPSALPRSNRTSTPSATATTGNTITTGGQGRPGYSGMARAGDDADTAPISCVMEEEEEPLIASAVEKVKIQVAMDSAAVDNVVHPNSLPGDAEPAPNRTGRHFVGAQGGHIEKYGSVDTKLETDLGAIGCHWQLADVTRPLHSVAKVTGPEDHPTGKQDVLFTNKRCVVVPPGVVEKILKTVKPVVEYARTGNLYIADMEMSSFPRQGQAV